MNKQTKLGFSVEPIGLHPNSACLIVENLSGLNNEGKQIFSFRDISEKARQITLALCKLGTSFSSIKSVMHRT